ncbi:MAG TPA: hypothetical protein PLE88_13250 [Anaerohalosphaeraceae bacterium]|nr:hypothetical protein [Anaerohalosphaeraceae bacterium]
MEKGKKIMDKKEKLRKILDDIQAAEEMAYLAKRFGLDLEELAINPCRIRDCDKGKWKHFRKGYRNEL